MIQDTSKQDVVVKPKRRTKLWILSLASVFVLGGLGYVLASSPAADISIERESLKVHTVSKGNLVRDIITTGKIIAANAPQVYSPEQGYVSLNVMAGDFISEGDIVAIVESPELQSALKQEQLVLASLRSDLARQELDVRRQTLLLNKQADLAKVELDAAIREDKRAALSIKNNLISQIDFEKAQDDLARAQVTHKHAMSEIELAEDTLAFELQTTKEKVSRQMLVVQELERQLDNLHIKASVSGVVGNVLTTPNALVDKNEPLMTLVDLSAYEAQLSVAESYAGDIGIGMDVELTVNGQTIMGKLASISPEVVERQVTARVRFPENSIQSIRQNQQVSARILLENKTGVLKVARGSFLQAGGNTAYLIRGDIAQKIAIQIGATSMREVEILEGLQEGDEIITSNYDRFKQAPSVLLR
ncbi:RND transporter MFP subunit [Alteromonas sp. KUL42]|uniref:efflux RND transporter periplasmic adaptor subunit n=1 Tax=Alteromonas sp. KUL42 TaxID=2480797 RepID=UPI0007917CDE|nr:HlyD family efflux transporter periplasmic adaptor subunit [Alteromonas sp. KUL42]KXJ61889.1 MAG: efflux transporter periplasmic adaptor subunit [Alteromonas sp. Nap_26]TAP37732.1 HlyD family efflux transporter periplasmic adaptor subunit [Alteromonas sp. KUL42]GEA06173.1 RND transporter MFP subunit [Alteromonas sp. KUL42]